MCVWESVCSRQAFFWVGFGCFVMCRCVARRWRCKKERNKSAIKNDNRWTGIDGRNAHARVARMRVYSASMTIEHPLLIYKLKKKTEHELTCENNVTASLVLASGRGKGHIARQRARYAAPEHLFFQRIITDPTGSVTAPSVSLSFVKTHSVISRKLKQQQQKENHA